MLKESSDMKQRKLGLMLMIWRPSNAFEGW